MPQLGERISHELHMYGKINDDYIECKITAPRRLMQEGL